MSYSANSLGKSETEITFTVAPSEYQKDLEQAAVRLSERAAIKGFRPGKAPFDIVKTQLGEVAIMEEALADIVQREFFQAIKKEKLETVGQPAITIEKMAPGNDLVFKAKVALLPKIKMADLKKIKVEKKKIEIDEKEIQAALDDLKKMRGKEVIKNEAATKEDKIVVDMEMFLDKVPLEGGQSKGHQVYLNEAHYIPGFADQLVGLKKGDQKEFSLKFPAEHYQKHIAGRLVDFKITAQDVFSLEYPELDDDFAKQLGQENLAKLKELLVENMKHEAEMKEEQRLEAAILDQLVKESEFGDLPEVLLQSEKQKMFHELKHDLEHRGIEMEKYLKDLKKTEEEIFRDFAARAEERVKAALVCRQVALDNGLKAEKEDLDKEIELIKKSYGADPKVEENLKRPEVLDTIAAAIVNRKVIALLKEKTTK